VVVLFLRRPTTVVAMLCWLLSAPPSRLFDGMVELETFPIMIFTYPQAPQCISNSSVGGTVYLQYYYGSIKGRGFVQVAMAARAVVEGGEGRESREGRDREEKDRERDREVESRESRQVCGFPPISSMPRHLTS